MKENSKELLKKIASAAIMLACMGIVYPIWRYAFLNIKLLNIYQVIALLIGGIIVIAVCYNISYKINERINTIISALISLFMSIVFSIYLIKWIIKPEENIETWDFVMVALAVLVGVRATFYSFKKAKRLEEEESKK